LADTKTQLNFLCKLPTFLAVQEEFKINVTSRNDILKKVKIVTTIQLGFSGPSTAKISTENIFLHDSNRFQNEQAKKSNYLLIEPSNKMQRIWLFVNMRKCL